MEDNTNSDHTSDASENRTSVEQVKLQDGWKMGGRLLSGLVGSNVLLFSCALLTCVFTEDIEIYETDFLIFLSIMMVICLFWMLFQMFFSWKHEAAILFKDCQAGPIWMRGGIILFGIGTLIMTSFKIAHTSDFKDCLTPMKIMQPVIQALFVIVQTCFLWVSCKHCVQIYMNSTRCFLMVLLAVNLTIWITAVTEESRQHTVELQKYLKRNFSETDHGNLSLIEDENEHLDRCLCKEKCVSGNIFIYLYPFNIEYNLFAAAMIYIMWKNVGRQIDENATHHHGLGPGVRQHIPFLGLVSGLSILIIGLVMFILYEVGRESTRRHWLSLTTFYFFHVISLVLMCLANIVGIIIFRLDKRNMDNKKNPSRTLDTVLLFGATLAQYLISYYSIIAMVSTNPFSLLCGLTLSYSILMIIQHSLQNAFIIQGLHRLPPNNLLNAHQETTLTTPVEHESIGHVTMQEKDSTISLTETQGTSMPKMSRRDTLTQHFKSHLKKRKTMKDVYLFLFLCNIIFWIMPAFGARIRFDTGLEDLKMDDMVTEEISPATKPSSEPDTKPEKIIAGGNHSLTKAGPSVLWKKGGRLLSGLLGLNVLLLATVLVSSSAFTDIALVEKEVLSLLCFLMGLTICWMIVFLLWTSRKENYIKLTDSHAGPIWLRVGLAVFAVCTLVMDVLKIGKSASLAYCDSPIKIVHPVFQALFVVIQTYFLWVSSKDCVQIHMNLTRCGLMLTLSTNLSIWMAAVTDESLHQTPNNNSSGDHRIVRAGGGSHGCDCGTDVCKTFQTAYYYLYPFNIEYSLFASTLSYVMWKNVGRVMNHSSHSSKHSLCPGKLFVGVICGVGILVSGLAVFIVYEIDVTSYQYRDQALKMFYIFNIVALSLMSLSSFVGSIIFRLDKRDTDNHKNPTRSLDIGLLIIAALGKYCISYFSVIAIVATSVENLNDSLNLVYSLLMIVQHTLQNIFIIEGLHREPLHDGHSENHNSMAITDTHEVYTNPTAQGNQGNHSGTENGHELDPVHHETVPHFPIRRTHIAWKRKIIKETSLFLLSSNIIFWIIPAFGARPQFENGREINFYGDSMWIAIVNIGLPFGIFYRMHAVASLLEVYVMS
ncbi:uncharacterized protein [Hyperolius riggenbachi]|uniref:uncharacterized protein n=1 Tax=Hyperolius riggenbachi TaxID=752182 RepID=UPI0035A3B222